MAIISTRLASEIVRRVSQETSVSVDDILSEKRHASVTDARAEVYRRMRSLGASYVEIGRLMQRNHSVVSDALRLRSTAPEIAHG